mgnify:FL=1
MTQLPEPLAQRAEQFIQQYQLTDTAELKRHSEVVKRGIALSEFLCKQLQRKPRWLTWLDQHVFDEFDLSDLVKELSEELSACEQESDAMIALRQWRNRHMCRIQVKDLSRQSTTRIITQDISYLAQAAIQSTLAWLQPRFEAKYGVPDVCPHSGEPQQLNVIAMGKFGAAELNLSSDIDLIFAFPEEGETRKLCDETATVKTLSHSEFFIRLGRKLNQLLDSHNAEGFVFRVDMRLRPWGQSGPLASTFNFLKTYYRDQGRDWERFAMIKARVVAGSEAAGAFLETMFCDFVYRRYVDFHALAALREMKQMIVQEVRRQGREHNIKLGYGGIREIEFIVQALQLIRGGQDPRLQQRNFWQLLPVIAEEQLLPSAAISELTQNYEFLRDVEHALQAELDQQTQLLPGDEAGWQRLALAFEADTNDQFQQRLIEARDQVSLHFNNFIALDETEDGEQKPDWLTLWQRLDKEPAQDDLLPLETLQALWQFKHSKSVQSMQARDRLDLLMPQVIRRLAEFKQSLQAWQCVERLLEQVLRRSAYLTLLKENPDALKQLMVLMQLSPWLADLITEKPYLLDELTDLKALFRLPKKVELSEQLHQRLVRLPEEDLEQQMEALRHFRHGRVLRAAACEVTETLPLMKISDYLAHIAEVIVQESFWLAWNQLVEKHGRPLKSKDEPCNPDFAVIGYGKLGGLELSYESDLDLVFIHDGNSRLSTEGPKTIENQVFFMRLGQKIIHLMSTITPSGRLYEVDMRLRPSGKKGLLVSAVAAFEKYQKEEAWTWEHQALVRARFIAGDVKVQQQFEAIRHEVLCRPRDLSVLQQEVTEMRQKMRDNLATPKAQAESDKLFNLKQDPGGIVDIEFMVQYGVLAWAQFYPQLTKWTDVVRLLESLEAVEFFTQQQTKALLDAYLVFRHYSHQCMLTKQSTTLKLGQMAESEVGELSHHRQQVSDLWQQVMASSPKRPH